MLGQDTGTTRESRVLEGGLQGLPYDPHCLQGGLQLGVLSADRR